MFEEEEVFLNTRGYQYQVAQLFRFHRVSVLTRFLKVHFPLLPFSIRIAPRSPDLPEDRPNLRLQVVLLSQDQNALPAVQESLTWFQQSPLEDTAFLTFCRTTDSLTLDGS